jgi:hypothetical protein
LTAALPARDGPRSPIGSPIPQTGPGRGVQPRPKSAGTHGPPLQRPSPPRRGGIQRARDRRPTPLRTGGEGPERRRWPVCVDRDVRLHGMSSDAGVVRRGIRLGLLCPVAIPYATRNVPEESAGGTGRDLNFWGGGGARFWTFSCHGTQIFYTKIAVWATEVANPGKRGELSLFWARDRPGPRSGPGRSRAEILRLTFSRFCTLFANSSPGSARIGGLYAPATTIAGPRANLPPAYGARANPSTSIQFRPLTGSAHLPATADGRCPRDVSFRTHRAIARRLHGPIHVLQSHPHKWTDSYHGPIADPPGLKPAGRDATAEPRPRSTSKRNAIAASDVNHSVGVQISIHAPDRPPHVRNPELRATFSKYQNAPSSKREKSSASPESHESHTPGPSRLVKTRARFPPPPPHPHHAHGREGRPPPPAHPTSAKSFFGCRGTDPECISRSAGSWVSAFVSATAGPSNGAHANTPIRISLPDSAHAGSGPSITNCQPSGRRIICRRWTCGAKSGG